MASRGFSISEERWL